jgi:hypothetical protein
LNRIDNFQYDGQKVTGNMSHDEVNYLVQVFTKNRHKYGDNWRKIRRDRVMGLFSGQSHEEVEAIIDTAIQQGKLETCIRNVDGVDYPALKLVKFVYIGKGYDD